MYFCRAYWVLPKSSSSPSSSEEERQRRAMVQTSTTINSSEDGTNNFPTFLMFPRKKNIYFIFPQRTPRTLPS